MDSVTLVIDESGAKGYSDKKEAELGELGVIAGFLVPNDVLDQVVHDFNELFCDYKFDKKKIHTTDLAPAIQNKLREKVFSYFKSHQVFWVYEAIYVEGYHRYANFFKRDRNKHYPRIKASKNKIKKLLHVDLFKGCFTKALDLTLSYMERPLDIKVVTDRVDEKTLKKFEKEVYLILSGEHRTITRSGYDSETNSVFKRELTIKRCKENNTYPDGTNINCSIKIEESTLTFVADILVNSVYHHLKKNAIGKNLNTYGAIQGHELSGLVKGNILDSSGSLADRIFYHPNMN